MTTVTASSRPVWTRKYARDDAVPLKEGWRIQRDTPGYGPRRTADALRKDLAAAKRYAEQAQ